MSEPNINVPEHLWEFDHPYYCSESNFFSSDCRTLFTSWQGFIREEGDNDFDMNLVFRWDWEPKEFLEDDSVAGLRRYADLFSDRDHAWILHVFWMGQRKGLFRVTEIDVCKADEPEVRAWLTLRAEHMRVIWEPLLAVPSPGTSS